jgi:Zn-dependent peptidase ImmA (M78 family)/transcriptional regulator with XRE-family HTH domain
MPVRPVAITGSVLSWAMTDAGLSEQDLAAALKVPVDLIRQWESGKEQPSTGQWRSLATLLRRPESFFLLPRPPQRRPTSVAFRTVSAANDIGDPELKESEAIRLARRIQKTASWVCEKVEDWAAEDLPWAGIEDSPDDFAVDIRSFLDWSVQEQTSSDKSSARVAHHMRGKLQDRGIVVLHLSLRKYVVRGFSLPDPVAPVVAINTQDAYEARLFSYVHELAHLCLKDDALCLTRQHQGVERWCNKVAASVLLPKGELRAYVRRRFGTEPISTITQVSSLKNHFRVSLRAIAIRLEDLGLGRAGLFDQINQEASEGKTPGGRADPDRLRTKPRIRIQQYGRRFVGGLIEAEDAGVLAPIQLQELLKLSRRELEEVKIIAASGSEG